MIDLVEPLGITSLIFGGCCANVYALEAIIRHEPDSGLLITFLQFVLTTAATYITQASTEGRYGLKPNTVPMSRWAIIAAMFCTINVLNNWAFAFHISVPVHIILRSFGSVTTMVAGMLRGKRYSPVQMLSVGILTAGVLISAWADSESKVRPTNLAERRLMKQGNSMTMAQETTTSRFTLGLTILLVAQLMSAFMGAFVEETYSKYKASWTENMFYSHFLSLPFFLPFFARLRKQYDHIAATAPLTLREDARLLQWLPTFTHGPAKSLPEGLVYLVSNAVTQLACISGVSLLSAKSSAVTVTIILNTRKLVSFMLSTLLFGHSLSNKMIIGSALVFGSGALYSWETNWRLPRQRRLQATISKKRN